MIINKKIHQNIFKILKKNFKHNSDEIIQGPRESAHSWLDHRKIDSNLAMMTLIKNIVIDELFIKKLDI